MALAAVETDGAETASSPHPATVALVVMLAQLAEGTADAVAGVDDDAGEADLVDQIGLLERLRSAVAARQAAAMVRLARARVARETALRHRPGTIGRGLVEEIGLACRISPTVAARRLGAARAWWGDLPRTYAALASGRLHERVAQAVVTETRHLDPVRRREVDTHLHPHPTDPTDPTDPDETSEAGESGASLADLGVRAALAAAAKAAYAVDPRAYVGRGRTERDDRYVSLRPAPDTMSWLSGYLPVEQGVACLAALKAHTDTAVAAGDDRTRGQIMADTLVERLTGQAHAGDVAVEIQLIIPTNPAGHPTAGPTGHPTAGPTGDPGGDARGEPIGDPGGDRVGDAGSPAAQSSRRPPTIGGDRGAGRDGRVERPDDASAGSGDPAEARAIASDEAGMAVDEAGMAVLTGIGLLPMAFARELVDTSTGRKHVRTLHRSPDGQLSAISARRRFSGALADLILARDQTCREPFCDAPVRHLDHIQRHADGGDTTLANGRGLCARHNLTREHPGWHAAVLHDGLGTHPHTVTTTTPTGHTYTSRAPNPP